MAVRNRVLANLPESDLALLRRELVPIAAQRVLATPAAPLDAVWLPESCVIDALVTMSDGRTVAMAHVGYRWFVAPPLLGSPFTDDVTFVCIVPGAAWRVPADAWAQALASSADARAAVDGAARWGVRQMMQLGACARLHVLPRRMATLLLLLGDEMGSSELPVTHERLASVLGVQRPSVSLVIHRFAKLGFVHANRGGITIVYRRGLETWACECYAETTAPTREIDLAGGVGRTSLVASDG